MLQSLHKKRPYSELFRPVFSRIWVEYRDLLCKSLFSVRMRENTDIDKDQKKENTDTFYAVNYLKIFS